MPKQKRQIVFVERLVPKWILLERYPSGDYRHLTRDGRWKAGAEDQATEDCLFDSKRAARAVFKRNRRRTKNRHRT